MVRAFAPLEAVAEILDGVWFAGRADIAWHWLGPIQSQTELGLST